MVEPDNRDSKNVSKILIVDDHELIRQTLTLLLEKDPAFQVVGQAENGIQALQVLEQQPVDIVILDVIMPEMGGLETAKRIRAQYPNVKIAILTANAQSDSIVEFLQEEVNAFLLKQNSFTELATAIRMLSAGGRYFSGDVVDALLKNLKEHPAHQPLLSKMTRNNRAIRRETLSVITASPDDLSLEELFSKREMEVLTELAGGLSTQQVADKLCISIHTVDTHRHNMFKKARVHTTADLIAFAKDRGLLSNR
jgi:DNA-binding NarL/FixJ family response regulator